ncbi:MAG: PP2C family protein-serine/threonine phosphatase [Actinomycetales bacterium]
MNLALRYAARSDIGLGRYSNNQDSGYAGPHLLVIADGMGGHAAGDVASSTAIARLVVLDDEAAGGGDALQRLTRALADANQDLRDRVAAEPSLHGMGTTVTAILHSGNKLALAHIGDSRGYLLRDGTLTQLTHDHTFVQTLVDEGRLTEDEARNHPQRNLITRVLTGEREDTPDLSIRDAKPGDTYLLCSDGLTGVVSEETLAEVLGEESDVTARAEALIDLALKGGASDNVTCIVADVVDLDRVSGPPTSPEVVGAAALHEITTSSAPADSPAGKAAALARQTAAAAAAGADDSDTDGVTDDSEAGEPKPKRHKGMLLLLVVLVLGLVGGGGYAAYAWSQQQYFVGTQAGNVAIYRGLPQDVGPVHLSSVYERQDLPVEQLPSYWRDQVQQRITAANLPKARAVVENLRQQAALCASPTATPTPTATATTSPTSGTATASATTSTATARPTTSTASGSPTTSTTSPTTSPDTGCGSG